MFHAKFQAQAKNGTSTRFYIIDKSDYHAALYCAAPIIPFLQDKEGIAWRLVTLTSSPPIAENESFLLPSSIPAEYADKFYIASHDYEYIAIEGTRLLELKNDGRSSAYGAYVRNRNTGATSYACANGKFFTHGQILKALDAIHKRAPAYDPTASYVWHPILFPYNKDAEEPQINLAYYLASEPILSFPMQFWGHESYDQQIKWIAEQEALI